MWYSGKTLRMGPGEGWWDFVLVKVLGGFSEGSSCQRRAEEEITDTASEG
jgi:hypothetical protein